MVAIVPFMIVFRFLHIVAGVLWVGSSFLFVGFIGPSAAEVGPSAGPLLSVAVKKRKVAKVITRLGATTVLAGWVMWVRDMNDHGSFGNWVGSRIGLVLTIGTVLATIAFIEGSRGVGRNVEDDAFGRRPRAARPDRHRAVAARGGRDLEGALLVAARAPG